MDRYVGGPLGPPCFMVRPDGSTIESLVHAHQSGYFQALRQGTGQTDRAPFIEFMLRMIAEAIAAATPPRVAPHVSPRSQPPCQP